MTITNMIRTLLNLLDENGNLLVLQGVRHDRAGRVYPDEPQFAVVDTTNGGKAIVVK